MDFSSYADEIDEKTWKSRSQRHSLNAFIWNALNGNPNRTKKSLNGHNKMVEIPRHCWSNRKITRIGKASSTNFSVVLRHGRTCPVKAWSGIVKWRTKETSNYKRFPVLVWDDHQIKTEEVEDKCELAEDSNSNSKFKCLYFQRVGRPHILWSVSKLARSVTRWTQACDRRLARLICYIHHTSGYRPYCHVV